MCGGISSSLCLGWLSSGRAVAPMAEEAPSRVFACERRAIADQSSKSYSSKEKLTAGYSLAGLPSFSPSE